MEPSSTEKLLYPPYGEVDSGTTREIAESIMQLQKAQAERRTQAAEGGREPERRQSTWNMFGGTRKDRVAAGSTAVGSVAILSSFP